MRLFLDTSVLLAASGSSKGASRAAWLVTLDEGDFHTKLGREVYGLRIATPGEFWLEQRAKGLI
ncbi:MAG TPA: hypothetical protein PL015_07335 [Opitutaceae bacterium]|nr:hypothetical protein [Opitutaceae bacterium]HPG17293.1 hypothetical protein [Opitutaceae bacterium]